MAARATSSLVRRTSFSSALNVLPTEINEIDPDVLTRIHNDNDFIDTSPPKPYSSIPGPKEWPIIGNSWRFAPIIGQYRIQDLDKVMSSLQKQYGKIAKVGGLMGHPDLLFVFDGDEIRKVFKREEVLPHRPSMPSLHHYKSNLRKEFFGDTAGVIGVHGEKWDTFRAQVQHVLLQPSTARKYIGPLNEIANDFMDRIHEMRDENNELPGDFLHELYKWALESVGRVALDTRLGCVSREGNDESKRIIDAINTFFWTVAEVELRMPVWRFYKTKAYRNYIGALDSFRELCMKHIDIAMENMKKDKEKYRDEEHISIIERIVDKTGNPKIAAVLALDLFLVGVDTTSVAVTSTIYQLSQNPEKQEKLFKELQTILPDHNSPIDTKILEQMPFLRACIKETLRMYPVVIGNGRNLQSDAVISGYKVPKGTHVIFPHLVVSNLEEYFPEPKRFLPERWIKRGEVGNSGTDRAMWHGNFRKAVQLVLISSGFLGLQDSDTVRKNFQIKERVEIKPDVAETNADIANCPHAGQKIHPFVSLPFGYGRRMCIGRRFAENELNILIAKIFRKYQIEYNYGKLTYKVSPTYIPEQPLKFKLTERTT